MNELEFKILLNQRLCDLADAIIYYYDPCQIKDGKCIQGESSCCCTFYSREHNGKCPFLGENGCTFKNIKCKTWFCETAIRSANPECIEAMKILEQFAKLYGLVRRPFLGEHYVGKNAEYQKLNEDSKTIS